MSMVTKKSKTRTVYRTAKSAVRRRSPTSKAATGPLIAGLAAGIAAQFASRYNAQFGPALGLGAVGFYMRNDALMTMAGMNLARSIPLGGLGAPAPVGGYI